MSNDDDQDDQDHERPIHKVETDPPTPGEDDAYDAETKVGPMKDAVVHEMMHAAAAKAIELSARAAPHALNAQAAPRVTSEEITLDIPRLYDDDVDAHAATELHEEGDVRPPAIKRTEQTEIMPASWSLSRSAPRAASHVQPPPAPPPPPLPLPPPSSSPTEAPITAIALVIGVVVFAVGVLLYVLNR